jgi:hypothetical protein
MAEIPQILPVYVPEPGNIDQYALAAALGVPADLLKPPGPAYVPSPNRQARGPATELYLKLIDNGQIRPDN